MSVEAGVDPKEIVRTGYDAAAAAYTAHRLDNVEPEVEELLDVFAAGTPAGGRVLDAGCGGGVIAARLTERFEVVGMDVSIEQLRLAREIAPGVRLVCQDITEFHPPEGSFDAICSLWTIVHVPRQEHLDLLRSFHRMLKPGALCLMSFGRTAWEGTERFFGGDIWWSHFDKDGSLSLLDRARFEILEVVDVEDRPGTGTAPFVLARRR